MKDSGVEEKDIQTTQYSITPEYNWTERGGRIFVGYVITQQITVKIRDFDNIGSILDKATADGANSVGDLQFTIDDVEAVIAEAREKRKMTQKQLAERIGTSQSVIARIENPSYDRFTIRTLRKIANALDANLEISLHDRNV